MENKKQIVGGTSGKTPVKSNHFAIKRLKHTRKAQRGEIGMSAAAIRRLARRGGVKRISGQVYGDAHMALRDFLGKVLYTIWVHKDYQKKNTVTPNDVVYALKQMGRTLYI